MTLLPIASLSCQWLLRLKLAVIFGASLLWPAWSNGQTTSTSAPEKIVFAVDEFPPWVIARDDGSVYGIDIQFATLLAERLELEVSFVLCPWARCLKMLEVGYADALVNVFDTPERRQFITFFEPAISLDPPKAFFLHAADEREIRRYDDLYNKAIGSIRGTSYFRRFDIDQDLRKVELVTDEQLLDMLLKRRIDLLIGTPETIDYLASVMGVTDQLKKAQYFFASKRPTFFGLAKNSPLNRPELIEKISVALQTMKREMTYSVLTEEFYTTQKVIQVDSGLITN